MDELNLWKSVKKPFNYKIIFDNKKKSLILRLEKLCY
jgi:hypothetical protein